MYKQHKWHFLWLKYDIELKKQVYDQNNFWINFVKKLNLEKNKFEKQKKITSFFLKLGPQILRDTGRKSFGYVTWLKYFLAVWHGSNIS